MIIDSAMPETMTTLPEGVRVGDERLIVPAPAAGEKVRNLIAREGQAASFCAWPSPAAGAMG